MTHTQNIQGFCRLGTLYSTMWEEEREAPPAPDPQDLVVLAPGAWQ